MVDSWFDIAIKAIRYYEELFGTKWPFGKLDHIFVSDYNMGAMENVGCILYHESFIEKKEVFTKTKRQVGLITLLHEISHMWFGNLVTMKWWDDLWLNESFATFISHLCLSNAPGITENDLSWSIFLDENFWGMKEDSAETTHPISMVCQHTQEAQDIFDGISYGKGACFLKQLYFYFGEEVLKHGL
jgi:aminopeptidase N